MFFPCRLNSILIQSVPRLKTQFYVPMRGSEPRRRLKIVNLGLDLKQRQKVSANHSFAGLELIATAVLKGERLIAGQVA